MEKVTSGVPQGSVLGTVLFLVYINDISENVSSSIRLFADDTVVYREIKSHQDHIILQNDLDKLYNWSTVWQMSFNVQKCFVLSVTRKTIHKSFYDYTMDNQLLPVMSSSKYLGVTISDSLRWSTHIDSVTSSARLTLGILQRNLSKCSKDARKLSYESLVSPKLEYSTSAWNPYTNKDVLKLEFNELVQRRAARYVSPNYSQEASVSKMLNAIGWDSLETCRTLLSLVLFYN